MTNAIRHPAILVLVLSALALAVGFGPSPLWDEDEPRFAAVARTMVESGDWIVPTFNGTLAVDKPVLMHWGMAAAFKAFGVSEFAARLPSAIATLVTALVLLRAGSRWFDPVVGVVAALAYVGCILVAIESHAATPDAILVALTCAATLIAAEGLLPPRGSRVLSVGRAIAVGAITGLAVLCKGPVGFVGPLAVVWLWAGWVSFEEARTAGRSIGGTLAAGASALVRSALALRPILVTLSMLAVAGPWYAAVSIRTAGAWPAGFFFVHNVGRFAAPMEKHAGSVLYHPLAMLVGFFPWSCFLPLAFVLSAWRIWKSTHASSDSPRRERAIHLLLLLWITIWVGTFSAAATKLPNYVLPAYPAAALLVAAMGVEACRRTRWEHPRWMAAGVASLVFGGVATTATILVAARYGLHGGEPAAVVGLLPILGAAACVVAARRHRPAALAAMAVTGLAFTATTVGPAGSWLARANTLPSLVAEAERIQPEARLGIYGLYSPNVVFYADANVEEFVAARRDDTLAFMRSGDDVLLILPEDRYAALKEDLPEDVGVLAKVRPLFRTHDMLLVGRPRNATARTNTPGGLVR